MHLKEREKLMNAVYTCPKLQKLTYFLLKKKGSTVEEVEATRGVMKATALLRS